MTTTSPARSSLAGLLRAAAHLDRTQSDPVVAARNAVGIAIPLAIGALAGNAQIGLATSIGAIQAAFADRPGPYRLRIVRMLGTALTAGVTSAVAVLASRSDAGSVLLLLVLSLIAGLLLAGGPSATQVGVAGVAAALIIGHIPQTSAVAVHVGLLVVAGGAVQTVLAIAAWPLGRHGPERRALAGLYRELAGVARAHPGTRVGPPAGDALTNVRQILYGLGHDHGPSVEAYRILLDEAERIRRDIVVLAALGERLGSEQAPDDCGLVRSSLAAAASVLDEVATALGEGRPVPSEVLEQPRATLRAAAARLSAADGAGGLTARSAAGRLHALSGQLRAAVESTCTGATEGRTAVAPDTPGIGLLHEPLTVLQANLNPSSAVFRHALRLALLVAGSDLVMRLADVSRGYWVPLTVLVVLRPDFGATLQRSVARVVGTIVGLLLATALVHWLPGGDWWQVALVALFAFGMRFAGPGNLALSAVCLSALVVVLLEIQGVSAHTTVESRAVATLAGGGLAIAAAVALPAWERRYVPGRLVELLDAYARYLHLIADPDSDRAGLQRARVGCRAARSNAQASVDRASAEPVRGEAQVELGRTVLAHTHRFIHAMLSIDAVRPQVRAMGGVPELTAFLAAAGDVLGQARAALADDAAPGQVGSLRPAQEALTAQLLGEPERAGGRDTATALVEATDRITNSLDTLIEELRRQLPLGSAELRDGLG